MSDWQTVLTLSVSEILGGISEKELSVASMIVNKAMIAGEFDEGTHKEWLEKRFMPNCVCIGEKEYAQMCIDSLKILPDVAGTDFGSSRQRDMGQLWADMTRGYLGEMAFTLFLNKHWEIESELRHERGNLKDYLPTDLHGIRSPGDYDFKIPKLKIGIKTTKWNGIWLDIPNDQFNHSDAHILVRVGTGRDHLLAFFKSLSVFKDKIIRKGTDEGFLNIQEGDELFDRLPNFKKIVAYICGFAVKDCNYKELPYDGKSGRLNFNITSWNGPIKSGDLLRIKDERKAKGKIKFEGIGSFAHDSGYLFNSGSLLWKKEDWEKKLIRRL